MTLSTSLHGIRTVAALELKQRLRTSRWPVVLGAWVGVIGLVTFLTWRAGRSTPTMGGTTLYDVLTFFVLGLSMLIMPSLTATSINGDREHGVLATLQTTLLTPADIVRGHGTGCSSAASRRCDGSGTARVTRGAVPTWIRRGRSAPSKPA